MDGSNAVLNIDCLPDEVLLHIFSYFGAEALSCILCNVCERWRCLVQDNTLWRTLSFFCDSETEVTRIRKVLSFSPALKTFAMHFRDDGGVLLRELCDNCESLQRLELKFCSLGSEDDAVILRIVTQYPNLSALSLESCQPLGTEALLHISSLRYLKKLNLSHCKRLTGETLWYIVEHCNHLTDLNIDHVTELYDEDITKVLRKLSSQLLVLTLDGEDITDTTYIQLQHCKRLTQLEISFCDQMTDVGLLRGIAPLEDINFLRLKRGYVLTANALSRFLNRPAMSCLLYLNLSECSSLDDFGLQGIAEKCAKLQYLALRWCWEVTDKGVKSIITHCSQLCVLDLLGAVQVTGMGYLNLIPSCVPYLKHLNLEQCDNVCDEEVNWLVKNMPKLVVIDYYGYQVTTEEDSESEEIDEL